MASRSGLTGPWRPGPRGPGDPEHWWQAVNAGPVWSLGSFDRPLPENDVTRTIVEFLTFLQLKGMSDVTE